MTTRRYHSERPTPPPPPAGCPVDADYLAEPYAIAAGLRDTTPVFYAEIASPPRQPPSVWGRRN